MRFYREFRCLVPVKLKYFLLHSFPEHSQLLKKRTNRQNAQINFGLINLLLFNHSNMFRPLNRSHHQGVQNP